MRTQGSKSRMIAGAIWGLGVGFPAQILAEDASPRSDVEEISEITVTARRIEERLQDVPVSITVYKQDQLDDANITNITDLTRFTPPGGHPKSPSCGHLKIPHP